MLTLGEINFECTKTSTQFLKNLGGGGKRKVIGAKESTQNFLFLFVFNKLKILSRFVHVLYKNGRQKAVFT